MPKDFQARGDHQFEAALSQHSIGILPVHDLALLGDLELAAECTRRLGNDRVVGRAAPASDSSPASVKESQLYAAFLSDQLQGAMHLANLPGAGQHAAVLV